ncbi:MAG: polysaccharide biosynthesis/export family protein [Balneolaceae bacterium]
MNIIRVLFPFLLIVLFISPNNLVAQQESQPGTGFNFQFNSALEGYYYQDALGSIIGDQIYTSDGVVDKNTYQLGPNDLITVGIEASENIVLRALVVNPQGDIIIPMLGSVNVANQTIAEAQETINEAAKEVFRNPNSTITLERARPLTVYVSGSVPSPGKHMAPPFSRVDVAIYGSIYKVDRPSSVSNLRAANNTIDLLDAGPLSFRNILITHADGSTDIADLVAYFKAGRVDKNPVVKHGDRISIKRLSNDSPRVSISGAINEEFELEYSETDSPSLLVDIAGGYKPEADTSRLFLYRHEAGQTEKIEIAKSDWNSLKIKPNDRIVIPVNRQLNPSTSAWVYGEVEIPGNFPIQNGETTAFDLLNLSGDLTNNALPSAAYLVRAGTLENEIPNKFNADLMKRTSDQVAQGFEYLDLETRLSQNKVFIDLTDDEQLKGVSIYDGDRLYVPRNEETIFVFGQINNPGYYPFSGNPQSVYNYIDRAGGFALAANRERIFIIKAGSGTWYRPDETTLESGDRIFIDRNPYDELNAQRTYEVQRQQLKNTRIQLIMTGITTITGIITTYVAITR